MFLDIVLCIFLSWYCCTAPLNLVKWRLTYVSDWLIDWWIDWLFIGPRVLWTLTTIQLNSSLPSFLSVAKFWTFSDYQRLNWVESVLAPWTRRRLSRGPVFRYGPIGACLAGKIVPQLRRGSPDLQRSKHSAFIEDTQQWHIHRTCSSYAPFVSKLYL